MYFDTHAHLDDRKLFPDLEGVLRRAREAGVTVSCDVNYRAPLWEAEGEFRAACAELLPKTDWLKVSEEEAAILTGEADPFRAGRLCRSPSP